MQTSAYIAISRKNPAREACKEMSRAAGSLRNLNTCVWAVNSMLVFTFDDGGSGVAQRPAMIDYNDGTFGRTTD